jgi:membrane-associated protease RseP (regulator of RpoE activity)
MRVEQGIVWLSHPAIDDAVPLPIATLATLASTRQPESHQIVSGRIGRLSFEQGSVWGCLVGGAAADDGDHDPTRPAGLAWRPLGALTASPLALTADGGQPQATITYVEPPRADAAAAVAGAIGGIGGHIGAVNGRPAVVGLIAGSAAQRAGVMPGEVILAIAPRGDGRFVDTKGLSLEDAQHLLRGRVGSKLQIQLQRNGQDKPREVAIVRQQIAQLGRNPQMIQLALQAHDRLLPPEAVNGGENAQNRFVSLLILRTGETLPCRVESIDEQGVRVQLPESEPVTVGADLVQAVELAPASGKSMTAEKFRSLSMLPRSQRQQPPTHVLRSMQGDYLRGRLVSMDAQTVRIAVEASAKGKPLSISRGDVARLIWLHPENLDTPWTPPQLDAKSGLWVESVAGDSSRLRMAATGVEGNTLLGTSSVVGPCRIDLERIDRLLIGGDIEKTQRNRPFSQWKLQPAPEPRNLPPRNP